MIYPVPGKGKPLGLMAPSWDSFQTSSIEADDRDAQCLSPKNQEQSYDSYDADDEVSYDPDDDCDYDVLINKAMNGWQQPEWLAMVRHEDREEEKKPHMKVRVETLKIITTNYHVPKRKRSPQVDACTYEETTAHTSTTKKVTRNTRMSVKPQDNWGFYFPDVPFVPEKPVSKTKQRLSALEVYQKEELIHREVVRRRLLNLENKKELNAILGRFFDAVNTMRTDL